MGNNHCAVECKRYEPGRRLDETELLGKMEQALLDNPVLDLWVLATTKYVDNQLNSKLRKKAIKDGIGYVAIEAGGSLSSLEILCAYGDRVLIDFYKRNCNLEPNKIEQLYGYLKSIRQEPGYPDALAKLKRVLATGNLGFDQWRISRNKWLLEQFSSEEKSKSSFGQSIQVCDGDQKFIKRKTALKELTTWFSQWKTHRNIFVLSGEEGDGKTWTAASWIAEYIGGENKAPVLFLSARNFPNENPDIERTLLNAASQGENPYDEVTFKRRMKRWMNRPGSDTPLFILVIDGLNENISFKWPWFLDKLRDEIWKTRLAVVLTCRSLYWQDRIAETAGIRNWKLPPFDDPELKEALDGYGLSLSEFSTPMQALLRKPRYMDLVVEYRDEIAKSGDVTVFRLIYEDFKKRIKKSQGLSSLTNDDFEGLILELSTQFASQKRDDFHFRDFADIVPVFEEKDAVFNELRTSGIFIRSGAKSTRYKVESHRLAYGLGVVLLDRLKKVSPLCAEALDEGIASLLEPQPEIDFKVDIVGAAVFHTMIEKGIPEIVRYELLKYWINMINTRHKDAGDFVAYFPCSPETYFNLAEETIFHHRMEYLFSYTFLRWAKEENLLKLLISRFERWSGYIFKYGVVTAGIGFDEALKKVREKKVREMLNCPTSDEASVFGCSFIMVEDEFYFRLSPLALSVISHITPELFTRAIITTALVDTIMVRTGESLKWILRFNDETLWPKIKENIKTLVQNGNDFSLKAAYKLLSYIGNQEAFRIRQTLPDDIFGTKTHLENLRKDECCLSLHWTRENYFRCLSREDISLRLLCYEIKELVLEPDLPVPEDFKVRLVTAVKQLEVDNLWRHGGWIASDEDSFIESCEMVLLSVCPEVIAKVMRSLIANAEKWEGGFTRHVVRNLDKNFLLIGKEELAAIEKMWQTHRKNDEEENQHDLMEWELFTIVFAKSNGLEQIRLLKLRNRENVPQFHFTLFEELDSPSWDEVCKMLDEKDGEVLWKILWHISHYPFKGPQKALEKIGNCLEHSHGWVRALAFKIIFFSGDSKLVAKFLRGSWRPRSDSGWQENEWGSDILAKFGTQLTFTELRERISPSYLGHAILQRPTKNSDIETLLKEFEVDEAEYKRQIEIKRKLKESTNTKWQWYDYQFSSTFCKEIIKVRPGSIKKWLDAILPDTSLNNYHLKTQWEAYDTLCDALLEMAPDKGAELYKRLGKVVGRAGYTREGTGIRVLKFRLFGSQKCPAIMEIWEEIFETCYTDYDALDLAIVNQIVGNMEWFRSKTEDFIASESLMEKARGINMLGFLDSEEVLLQLEEIEKNLPDCWMHPVIQTARVRCKRNLWAKEWFKRFLESEDDVMAWAAFKLFQKCVDRRYWAWKDTLIEKSKHLPYWKNRMNHLILNRGNLKRSTEKIDKDLKETFLDIKIRTDIWPWG